MTAATQPLSSAHSAISTAAAYWSAISAGVFPGTRRSKRIVNIGYQAFSAGSRSNALQVESTG